MQQFVICNQCGESVPVPDVQRDQPPSDDTPNLFWDCPHCGADLVWTVTPAEMGIELETDEFSDDIFAAPAIQLEPPLTEESEDEISDQSMQEVSDFDLHRLEPAPEDLEPDPDSLGPVIVFSVDDNSTSAPRQLDDSASELPNETYDADTSLDNDDSEPDEPSLVDMTEPMELELDLEDEDKGAEAEEDELTPPLAATKYLKEERLDLESELQTSLREHREDSEETNTFDELQDRSRSTEEETIESNSTEEESTVDWGALRNASRPKPKREASAFAKVVPPVLGGLAAFPIATLIMWYGFGKDIANAGPVVAKYVPWIVPQKLRGGPSWSRRDNDDSSSSIKPNATRPDRNPQARSSRLPSLNSNNDKEESQPTNRDTTTPSNPDSIADTSSSLLPKSTNPLDASAATEPKAPEIPEREKDSISSIIAKLREMQTNWESTPSSEKEKVLTEYYANLIKLSEYSGQLKGRSFAVWHKELEQLAGEIFKHPKIPTVILLGSKGKLPSTPRPKAGDYIATVTELTLVPDLPPDITWIAHEKWLEAIPIHVQPEAMRSPAASSRRVCLLFGQLLKVEGEETAERDKPALPWILQVHAAFPK